LARYPVTEGYLINISNGTTTHEALWVPVLNVSVWAVILSLLAIWLVRRGRARQ